MLRKEQIGSGTSAASCDAMFAASETPWSVALYTASLRTTALNTACTRNPAITQVRQ